MKQKIALWRENGWWNLIVNAEDMLAFPIYIACGNKNALEELLSNEL